MIFRERPPRQRTLLSNSTVNKHGITHAMGNAGAQLALCNFYTASYLSLDILLAEPQVNKCAFCLQIGSALMLRPTLIFYIWDVLWPQRCLSVPLCSFPAALDSTLHSPPPLFILTPLPHSSRSARLSSTGTESRRQ